MPGNTRPGIQDADDGVLFGTFRNAGSFPGVEVEFVANGQFDAVTKDFVDHKFDVKHLMRTILNSAAYQRSSVPLADNKADDRFYARYLIRRLPAEVVLDAYSALSKVPTKFAKVQVGTSGGDMDTADYPLGTFDRAL